MPVTVSIVTHKTPEKQLTAALDSLMKAAVDRIYVIDNSPDNRLQTVASKYDKVIYSHVENRGFGAGHNLAIREVLSKDIGKEGYHLVMNADVNWEGDVISPIIEFMEANPKVGMVMPKTFYPDGMLQYTCRMLPTPFDLFAKRFLPENVIKKRMNRYLLASHNHDVALNCPYLLGSFLMFRNKAFEECGVFDERFFMYPEDIDITRRIHAQWETLYWPEVSIIHAHEAASRKNLKMLRIHIVNMIKYFNKWGWFFDSKRKKYNRRLLDSLTYQDPSQRPPARG